MTLTDIDMSNNCLKLKEASLQLSDTVKQMEQALAKQRHSMVEQASLLLAAQQEANAAAAAAAAAAPGGGNETTSGTTTAAAADAAESQDGEQSQNQDNLI